MNKLTTKADLHDKLKYAARLLTRYETAARKVLSVPELCIRIEEFQKMLASARVVIAERPIDEASFTMSCIIRHITDAVLKLETSVELRA